MSYKVLVFNKLAVSLIVVIFFIVVFVMVIFLLVVFVIAHCHNLRNTAPHGVTAAEALISSSAVVQEGYSED